MKRKTMYILILIVTLVCGINKVNAAEDEVLKCEYNKTGVNDKYDKYKFTITYDPDFPDTRYINFYLGSEAISDPDFGGIYAIVKEPLYEGAFAFDSLLNRKNVYFQKESANNVNELNTCPKYAYFADKKNYCFDNDGKYCNSVLGSEYDLIKSESMIDYIKEEDSAKPVHTCGKYTVQVNDINNKKTVCNIKVEVDTLNRVNVFYKDYTDFEYASLGYSKDSFTCGSKTVYLTNKTLKNPINNRSEFDNAFLGLTKDNTYCPRMPFALDSMGNKVAVLENSIGEYNANNLDGYYNGFEWGNGIGENVSVSCENFITEELSEKINLYMSWISVLVPIILIGFGMFDFSKAMLASKEDEMKKALSTFIKRLIIGVIIFLLPVVVDILIWLINTIGSDIVPESGICDVRW